MEKMTNSELFNEEVKQLLSGYISDEDTRNYLAIKITRLHEEHTEDEQYRT